MSRPKRKSTSSFSSTVKVQGKKACPTCCYYMRHALWLGWVGGMCVIGSGRVFLFSSWWLDGFVVVGWIGTICLGWVLDGGLVG